MKCDLGRLGGYPLMLQFSGTLLSSVSALDLLLTYLDFQVKLVKTYGIKSFAFSFLVI